MPRALSASSSSFNPKAVTRARKLLEKNEKALPRMADLYKLLANPVRLKILLSLSEIDRMCVGDISQALGLSIAATSHQLKMLKERGWLGAKGQGKHVYYYLANPALKEALEGDLRMLNA